MLQQWHFTGKYMKYPDNELFKQVLDTLSVVTVLGALVNALPAIAALFTILWTGIRIWETDTIRRLTGRNLIGVSHEET